MNRSGIAAVDETGSSMSVSARCDHVGRWLHTLEHYALNKCTLLTCLRSDHARALDTVCAWWMFTPRGWDGTLPAAALCPCCTEALVTIDDAAKCSVLRRTMPRRTVPVPAHPDLFTAEINATLEQQILDDPEQQLEADVHRCDSQMTSGDFAIANKSHDA